MVALFFLARLDLTRHQAERAVLLTAIFPFSFFFGMVYTEALFLLLTVLSFYAFRSQRWILGGLIGGLATATRVNGILMLPALALVAFRVVQPTLRDRTLAVLGLALVPAGIGAYSAYIFALSGHPFEWFTTIQRWGYYPGGLPWTAPLRLIGELVTRPYEYLASDPMAPYDTLHGITAIVFIALIPLVWLKFGAGYGVFMLLNLWLPLSSGVFEGIGRYCSVLFPAFLWLATIRSRAVAYRSRRDVRPGLYAGACVIHNPSSHLLEGRAIFPFPFPFFLSAKSVKVRPAGLEPATPGLGNRCSILLSYGRVKEKCTRPDQPLRRGDARRQKVALAPITSTCVESDFIVCTTFSKCLVNTPRTHDCRRHLVHYAHNRPRGAFPGLQIDQNTAVPHGRMDPRGLWIDPAGACGPHYL